MTTLDQSLRTLNDAAILSTRLEHIHVIEELDATSGSIGLFGFTELAKWLVIEFCDREIRYVIDNDPAKQGERFNGVEVVSFEHALARPPDVIAIASTTSLDEIQRQIESCPAFANTRIVSTRSAAPNDLSGDRDVEYSWVAAMMPPGPGRALDFGCGFGNLGLLAAQRGYTVTALDLRDIFWRYEHPDAELVRGDVFDLDLSAKSLDLVINCSTVEHVGLAGRYGSPERPDGDLEAMQHLLALTKPGGIMLVTIPVGRDAVFRPLHRVYGRKRLPRLLDGWDAEQKQFWIKDEANKWVLSDEAAALDFEPTEKVYALGCFVLRRPADEAEYFWEGT